MRILMAFIRFGLWAILLLVVQQGQAKTLRLEDWNYEPETIRSILIYPVKDSKTQVLDMPIAELNANYQMVLEFDELSSRYQNYYFRIIPCNYDWSPSILNDLEYLDTFNEFRIEEYEMSNITRVQFTHYLCRLPRVKLSGNYVVAVYRGSDQEDLLLTRRFMIFENDLAVNFDVKFPIDPKYRFIGQQIDFTLGYNPTSLFNPREMVHTVVRQNGRWDNARYDLKANFIREEDRLLDFHFFNNENVFEGGNEFRGFDVRTMRSLGQGMADFYFDNTKAEIRLIDDKPRRSSTYNQWIDINGRFVIENFETRAAKAEADYVYVTFTLDAPKQEGEVYIHGLLTDFTLLDEFKMTWDPSVNKYKARLFLKQGFYNYQYVLKRPNGTVDYVSLEGSHNMTENLYDVLVYFRPIGSRYDRLIGYGGFKYFGERR